MKLAFNLPALWANSGAWLRMFASYALYVWPSCAPASGGERTDGFEVEHARICTTSVQQP